MGLIDCCFLCPLGPGNDEGVKKSVEAMKRINLEDENFGSTPQPPILSIYQILILLLLLSGCASSPRSVENQNIVWPKPPEKARIGFIKSVSQTEDIKVIDQSGWINSLWRFLTGATPLQGLYGPYGVTADNDGDVFVVDRDTREVFVFNLLKEKSSSIFIDTKDLEDYPIGITIADNLYITYPNTGRVVICSTKGEVLKEIGEGTSLKRPTGIAVNQSKGLLYVVDTNGHEVKVFDLSGKYLFTFGKRGDKEGELNYPTHVFVARDNTVYVTDELNFRIQAFSSDGQFLFKIGKAGTVPGTFESPKGVAVDSDGNIYVADAMSDTIQMFNKEGQLLLFFGGSGSDDGQFYGPAGIFIDKTDRIYITDLYNSRVQVFQYLRGE